MCVCSFRLIATLDASLVSQLVCPHLFQSPFLVSCGLQLSQRKPSFSLSLNTWESKTRQAGLYIFRNITLHYPETLENERFYCSHTCSACQQSRFMSLSGTFYRLIYFLELPWPDHYFIIPNPNLEIQSRSKSDFKDTVLSLIWQTVPNNWFWFLNVVSEIWEILLASLQLTSPQLLHWLLKLLKTKSPSSQISKWCFVSLSVGSRQECH